MFIGAGVINEEIIKLLGYELIHPRYKLRFITSFIIDIIVIAGCIYTGKTLGVVIFSLAALRVAYKLYVFKKTASSTLLKSIEEDFGDIGYHYALNFENDELIMRWNTYDDDGQFKDIEMLTIKYEKFSRYKDLPSADAFALFTNENLLIVVQKDHFYDYDFKYEDFEKFFKEKFVNIGRDRYDLKSMKIFKIFNKGEA